MPREKMAPVRPLRCVRCKNRLLLSDPGWKLSRGKFYCGECEVPRYNRL